MPKIIIIAAVSENNVIGKDGAIPWNIREDLQHFKQLTTGFPCIMGRNTYLSLPRKPLPNRPNIIISSTLKDAPDGVFIFTSLKEAISSFDTYEKIFICGGSSIYKEAVTIADEIELTRVHGIYEGDTFFPVINMDDWDEVNTIRHTGFSYITLRRKKQ
ncbi:dihydrofolate reductase [Brucepastera parasyntrophica]|uniref:dihydrofolate reductase n=1 Tax=Brucepastera parasyntrophica TaxID=2880008 RepID=UPI00210E12EA|nr:dihydrofolate reductase [Brucepastera parasyntrophica]ULQ58804.1 dihydrofolate reductase [Brucepastera parasyntrophica]